MKILFADTDFWNGKADLKKKFKTEIARGYKDAKKLLPIISDKLSFVVQANPRASIPEIGSGARTQNSELIIISFDPSLPYKEEGLLKSLRPAVFHEMNHVARFTKPVWHKTFLENCLMEGLATVFERERAEVKPIWGDYPKNVEEWIEEVKNAKTRERACNCYLNTPTDGAGSVIRSVLT